jgi:hypothetical protein
MRAHMEAGPTKPEKFSSLWYAKAGLLYFVAAGRPPVAIKIGVTQATTMKTRLKAIQSANHEPVELLGVIRFDYGEKPLLQAERAERELHTRFADSQRLVDWSVGYEWFTTSQELLDYITAHATPPEQLGLPRSLAQIREPLPDAPCESVSPKEI